MRFGRGVGRGGGLLELENMGVASFRGHPSPPKKRWVPFGTHTGSPEKDTPRGCVFSWFC